MVLGLGDYLVVTVCTCMILLGPTRTWDLPVEPVLPGRLPYVLGRSDIAYQVPYCMEATCGTTGGGTRSTHAGNWNCWYWYQVPGTVHGTCGPWQVGLYRTYGLGPTGKTWYSTWYKYQYHSWYLLQGRYQVPEPCTGTVPGTHIVGPMDTGSTVVFSILVQVSWYQ